MMGHLLAVKEKQVQTDDMFGPLLATFELLKTYGQQMSEEVYVQLQVCFTYHRLQQDMYCVGLRTCYCM